MKVASAKNKAIQISRNPTMEDIAKALKISKSAVSLAFANSPRISDKLKERIFIEAQKVGYKKNRLLSDMMSGIKKGMTFNFSENIALLNGNYSEDAFQTHPTLPIYLNAIRDEAKKLGYAINEFWLMDPTLTAKRLSTAFRTRNIRGGLIIGHNFGISIPHKFDTIWKEFYFVSIGIKMQNPKLEMVSSDNYAIAQMATRKAIEYGFKRPALVLDPHIDDLVDGSFLAAFLREQSFLPIENKVPPFLEHESAIDFDKRISSWLKQFTPDVIIHLTDSAGKAIRKAIEKIGYKVKFIQLERRRTYDENWSGVEQNNDVVGRIAIHRLADTLRKNSIGVETYKNMVTLIPPTWIAGALDK